MDQQPTFVEFMSRERDRLNGERTKIDEQIAELSEQRAGIERELSAIKAYEIAKSGVVATRQGRGRQVQPARRLPARGSRREGLLKLIQENPTGMSRGEILEKMGLKGNKSGEMSISNALTALTKGHQVRRDNGKYMPAA